MKIIVSGSSGTIGSALIPELSSQGHAVTRLVRSKPKHPEAAIGWDPIGGTIDTTGLPPGAYTNWWFVYNNPEACRNPQRGAVCFGGPDLFNNPAVQGSAFWATGGVVGQDGAGRFVSRKCVGDSLGTPETQHIAGPGVLDPMNDATYVIVRYHGPASDNLDMLYWQTHSLLAGCSAGANATGVHCPNLQIAVFNPPGR